MFRRKVQRDERDVIQILKDLQLSGCSIIPYTLILPYPQAQPHSKKFHIETLVAILIAKEILVDEPHELTVDELNTLDEDDYFEEHYNF